MTTVDFTSSTSGATLDYTQWAFGDGSSATTVGLTTSHNYRLSGIYKADATYHSTSSTTGSATNLITVDDYKFAEFSSSWHMITNDTLVNFTDLSPGSPTAWLWKFSDGADGTSILQNPSHMIHIAVPNGDVSLRVVYGDTTCTRYKSNYIIKLTPPITITV